MTLLSMSITAGIMILVIILIRSLLIHRLPKKTFLFLWAVVLCRLLIPFSFSSPLSIYNSVPEKINLTKKANSWNNMVSVPIEHNVIPASLPAADKPADQTRPAIPWPVVIWLGGTFLCASFFLISYLRYRKKFKESLPADHPDLQRWISSLKLKRPVIVRQSEYIEAPLTYGIFKPVILLPKDMDWENEELLLYIFAHELVHIRRLDGIWKFVMTSALCIHWFNPLVWGMYFLFNRDLELACDERVVKHFGQSSRSSYALTLIGMEEKKSGFTPIGSHFSKTAMKERIGAIMKIKKTTLAAILAASAIVCSIVVVFATSASRKPYSDTTVEAADHTPSPDMPSNALVNSGFVNTNVSNSNGIMEKDVRPYIPFGLTYDRESGSMYYEGKPVREIYDSYTGIFITESLGINYPVGAIDLTVTYKDGAITGLKETSQEEYEQRSRERAQASAESNYLHLPKTTPSSDYVKKTYPDLLSLKLDGYENMTISQYRKKVNEITASWGEMTFPKRIDEMTSDEILQKTSFQDPDAFFLMYTLRLTIMDGWKHQFIQEGGIVNNAEIVCSVEYTILDPDSLTVGERDRIFKNIINQVLIYPIDKLPDELSNTNMVDQELNELIKQLNKRFSDPGISFKITPYCTYLESADNGYINDKEGQDDSRDREYESLPEEPTKEDVQRMLMLKTKNYKKQSLEEFNHTLLSHMNDDPGFWEAWERIISHYAYNEAVGDTQPFPLTEKESDFLFSSLNSSNLENAAMIHTMKGMPEDPCVPGQTLRKTVTEHLYGREEEIESFSATLYYGLTYVVSDPKKTTVGERDQCLSNIMAHIKSYLDKQNIDRLASLTKEDIKKDLDSILKKYSTKKIKVRINNVDSDLSYEVYDERDWVSQENKEWDQKGGQL